MVTPFPRYHLHYSPLPHHSQPPPPPPPLAFKRPPNRPTNPSALSALTLSHPAHLLCHPSALTATSRATPGSVSAPFSARIRQKSPSCAVSPSWSASASSSAAASRMEVEEERILSTRRRRTSDSARERIGDVHRSQWQVKPQDFMRWERAREGRFRGRSGGVLAGGVGVVVGEGSGGRLTAVGEFFAGGDVAVGDDFEGEGALGEASDAAGGGGVSGGFGGSGGRGRGGGYFGLQLWFNL